MIKHLLKASILGLLGINIAMAHQVQLNQTLPHVSVNNDGELIVNNQKVDYRQWNSSNLIGKVRVVHHLAGRSSVKEKNQPLMDAIKEAAFDRKKYQTTTIINADDVIVATGAFVKNSAENGKLENPHSQVILDQEGVVRSTWGLKEKESFIAVLDKNGQVQFVSEGTLSAEKKLQVIDLVKQLLSSK